MADDTLTGRVRRYAQVGTTMAGLGVRLAGEKYLGIEIDRAKHAADLKVALGGLKGPLMKVAQLLATIPDAIPKEYAKELQQLQSNAPAMGGPFVKRRVAGELGPGWRSKFADFEETAAAAASLGQVHRATLLDGRKVAVKLQYPDMASAVEADLKQLKMIFNIHAARDNAIKTDEIYAEIGERLREELDYERERKQMDLYRLMLAGEAAIHVPEAIPELSTKRLLTMTWLEGRSLMTLGDAPLEVRNQAAIDLFRAWYVPFYFYGAIHGDPHPGNYQHREGGGLNLLDFGCVRIFSPGFVQGVIDLYHALDTGDRDLAVSAYERWGFKDLSNELIEVLNNWASFLYGPILEDRTRLIDDARGGSYGREVAEKVHEELRRLGGVKPPREFVFMDRAAIGLGSVFTHLKAEVNWYRLFQDIAGDFKTEDLADRQSKALTAVGLTTP